MPRAAAHHSACPGAPRAPDFQALSPPTGEHDEVAPRQGIAVLLLDGHQQAAGLVEIRVVGPCKLRLKADPAAARGTCEGRERQNSCRGPLAGGRVQARSVVGRGRTGGGLRARAPQAPPPPPPLPASPSAVAAAAAVPLAVRSVAVPGQAVLARGKGGGGRRVGCLGRGGAAPAAAAVAGAGGGRGGCGRPAARPRARGPPLPPGRDPRPLGAQCAAGGRTG
jgi:hypothetical protein